MKDQYINRTLQPPEPPEDADQKFEELIKWIREDFKPEKIFDLYEHDKEVAIGFSKWMNMNGWEKHPNGYFHREQVQAGKQTWFNLEELWEQFCKQHLNK